MKTLDFKPKTIMEARKFPSKEKTWVIGLDIGYSAVKGFCPNKLFSFPSYARQIPENRERMKAYGDTDICYRDRNGLYISFLEMPMMIPLPMCSPMYEATISTC